MTMHAIRTIRIAAAVLAAALTCAGGVVSAGASVRRSDAPPPPRCAANAAGARSSAHGSHLLVPGHPSSMLLCHYGPLPQQNLVGSRYVTSRARLRRITHRLNSLPPMPRVPMACPIDNGAKIVIYVYYRKGPARVVHLELGGCMMASRGSVLRWDAPDHGRLFSWLTRLTS